MLHTAKPIQRRVKEEIDPALAAYFKIAELPRFYALILRGDCMEPVYADGAKIIADKEAPLLRGDDAVFHFKPGVVKEGYPGAALKRLVLAMPPVTLPYRDNPQSNCIPAVHKCIGLEDDVDVQRLLKAERRRA